MALLLGKEWCDDQYSNPVNNAFSIWFRLRRAVFHPWLLNFATRQMRMGRIFEKRKETIFKTAAQKSKLYSKYGRQLYMAAKNGVPDPEANSTLRSVIERAKRDNVASHVIEKAIQKAAGTGGEDFQAA